MYIKCDFIWITHLILDIYTSFEDTQPNENRYLWFCLGFITHLLKG